MAEREGEWECVRCGQDGCVSVSGGTGDFWQTSLLSSASALTKPGLVGGSNKTRTGPHWPHSNGVPEPHHGLLAGEHQLGAELSWVCVFFCGDPLMFPRMVERASLRLGASSGSPIAADGACPLHHSLFAALGERSPSPTSWERKEREAGLNGTS